MSKHTPGPWTLTTVPTNNGSGSAHKIGPFPASGVYATTHACIYADNQRIGIDDENCIAAELRANARLIAAAPDLLHACITGLHYIDAVCFNSQPGKKRNNYADAATILRAAIAKATGA